MALHKNLIAGNTATHEGDEIDLYIDGYGFLEIDANLFGHSGVSTADALYGYALSAGLSDGNL